VNIVILVKDRPALTRQCITTLLENTDPPYTVTIVDDESKPETEFMLKMAARQERITVLRNVKSKGITGQVRNLGVYWSRHYWGKSDLLYLSDNDVAFTPHWNTTLIDAYCWSKTQGVRLLGGQNHPYHQHTDSIDAPPHSAWQEVRIYGAVAGTSQLMTFETWDKYGPLDAHAAGVCQSEDHKFCQQIVKDGYRVGAIWPHVVIDCGIHQTDGSLSVGHEAKARVEGIIYG